MASSNDINELMDKWYKVKQEIMMLEKRCDKYKKYAEKMLDRLDSNSITGSDYSLKRVNTSRRTIGKADVPTDIWSRYSRQVSYPVYYLKPLKR